jgi:hypothetical protein
MYFIDSLEVISKVFVDWPLMTEQVPVSVAASLAEPQANQDQEFVGAGEPKIVSELALAVSVWPTCAFPVRAIDPVTDGVNQVDTASESALTVPSTRFAFRA